MNNLGIQLRVGDIIFAVQKRWRIIALLTLLGLVFGLMLSSMKYVQSTVETYEISGSFIIAAVDSKGTYSGNNRVPTRNDFTLAGDMYDTIYYLLRSERLLTQVINDQQLLGVTMSDLRNAVSISRYNDTTIMTFKLNWDNVEEGLVLWDAILNTANSLITEIVQVGTLRIINDPTVSVKGTKGFDMKTWMVLPVLGFAAGMGLSIIELLMHPTLINVKDVETVFGLETLGVIPHDPDYFRSTGSILVREENTSSSIEQDFAAAAFILRNRMGTHESGNCFYVTSAIGREGRTSVAANIAIQLSDMERHTLLIDLDYKNPMLGTKFLNDVEYTHSLNALYRGEVTVTDAITTLTGYLDILPMVMEHNLIYMDSSIMNLIASLKEQYEFVIIDAPPVGKESDTLSLNQVANTVLYVARYDTSSIPEIQSTLDKLDKSGIRVLGCIVNDYQSPSIILKGAVDKNTSKQKEAKKAKTGKKQKNKKPKQTEVKADVSEQKENDAELQSLVGAETTEKQETASKAGKSSKRTGTSAKKAKSKKTDKEQATKKHGLFGRKSSDKKAEKKAKDKISKGKKTEANKKSSVVLKEESVDELTSKKNPRASWLFLEDMDNNDTYTTNSLTDDEVTEALLKMGLEGTWDAAVSESQKEKKKNLFEDL